MKKGEWCGRQARQCGRQGLPVLPALRAEQKVVRDTKKQNWESDSLAIRKWHSWVEKARLDEKFHRQHWLFQGQPKFLIESFIPTFASNQELFLPPTSYCTFQNLKPLLPNC